MRDGRRFNLGPKRKVTCWRGHPMNDAYQRADGTRQCRTCKLAYEAKYYREKKAS